MSGGMKPFLFDRSFDEGSYVADKAAAEAARAAEEAAAAEPVEIVVTYSEEELAAAKQESYMDGHADGFREGHAEAMDTLERQLNELLEKLAPLVSALGDTQRDANDRAQANMARIVQEMMAKLMPVYVREHGSDEAVGVVADCLKAMQDPGRLTIHLSEETADLLGDRLSKVAARAGFEGQIRLLPDEELGTSDVRVDWGAGGAERRYDSIREEIDEAIDRAVARIEAELGPEPVMESTPEEAPPVEDVNDLIGEPPEVAVVDEQTADPISETPEDIAQDAEAVPETPATDPSQEEE